jgi:Putative metal-binding motif
VIAWISALAFAAPARDGDGDGAYPPADCDDGDAGVYPGAPEDCDGIDQDCDGDRDGGDPDHDLVPTDCDVCPDVADELQADADGDGVGDACEPTDPVEDTAVDTPTAEDEAACVGCRGLGFTYGALPLVLLQRRRRSASPASGTHSQPAAPGADEQA